MSDIKIIHELTEDELIQIARGAKVEQVMEKASEAAKFIYTLGIREGRVAISAMLVYHTFKQYKGVDNKRQAKRYFFKDFNKYFKPFRTKNGLHYMLDPRSFDLSKENFWLMRADMRQEKQRRKK